MKTRTCLGANGSPCPWRVDLSFCHRNRTRCPKCVRAHNYRGWQARAESKPKTTPKKIKPIDRRKNKAKADATAEACRKAREVSAEISNPKAATKLVNLLINAV